MRLQRTFQIGLLWLLCVAPLAAEETWPALPPSNGAVQIPAQEWPMKPGPREVTVTVHYPGGKLEKVNAETGLMLTLHNWGGTACVGTANPVQLAERYNVVCLCVDYLQSGPKASIEDPEPYDFGYLQGLDALRAIYWLEKSLIDQQRPYAKGRMYVTGGSGGGNVTLMANKLAPRTFACCVDICGMAKLSDDIAYNLPGGSDLDARFSRDPQNPNYLSPDHQQLRFVGDPSHLATMKKLGSAARMIVVHGLGDVTCPVADAQEMVANMQAAKLNVQAHFIGQADVDGTIYHSTGHSVGNRTLIVFKVADQYLLPGGPMAAVRGGPSDFERREDIIYPTANGKFVISYANGYPVGRFEGK